MNTVGGIEMKVHKFVFIGGLHRSGTTLLANILSQHPDISMFHNTDVHEDEGQFLQSIYPTDNAYGGPGRFAFDRKAHLTEESSLGTDDNKKKLFDEWAKHWDMNKNVLIEKTPSNIIQSHFLQSVFPNSYFIFIIRHPVASSVATYKWSGTGIYSLINHWVAAHEILENDITGLRHSIVISYESLVSSPQGVLREIEGFIGITNHKYYVSVEQASNDKYFSTWRKNFLCRLDRAKPIPPLGAVHDHRRRGLRNMNLKRILKSYIKKYLFGEERQMSHSVFEAQDAVEMFETRVRHFGYSLIDLKILPHSPLTLQKSAADETVEHIK
jgi:hypothetical protein